MTTLRKAAQDAVKTFVERVERLEGEKKEIADDIASVYAEAKAAGYDTKALRTLVRLRKQDATERAEEESILATYLHACGMAKETPLFASVGAMSIDTAAREQVIEAFKLLVPRTGEIIVKMAGQPVRLWRDGEGIAHAEDYVEPTAPPKEKPGKALKKPSASVTVIEGGKRGPSADEIKRIADDAEARSKEKKPETQPEKEPEPTA